MIPQKQRSTQADWVGAVRDAYQRPDVPRARRLVEGAVAWLRQATEGYHVAYGWSGGKDSQGLRIVCEAAGITECVLVISELEYPAFLTWATDHMPWGCTVEARPLDLAWLARNPDMLFPADAKTAARWFRLVQHTGQRAYARQAGIDALVLGRRTADGNHTGGGRYRDRAGFDRISPIAGWSHEDLLCVLGAHRAPLPPCYGWPRGFRVGTGAWPARQWTRDRAHGWREVASIDAGVAELAATAGIPGAAEALRCAAS